MSQIAFLRLLILSPLKESFKGNGIQFLKTFFDKAENSVLVEFDGSASFRALMSRRFMSVWRPPVRSVPLIYLMVGDIRSHSNEV